MQAGTEEEKEKAGRAAVIIQKHYRGHAARKHVQELRLSVTLVSICQSLHEPHPKNHLKACHEYRCN